MHTGFCQWQDLAAFQAFERRRVTQEFVLAALEVVVAAQP
jgi:hypothetical protein